MAGGSPVRREFKPLVFDSPSRREMSGGFGSPSRSGFGLGLGLSEEVGVGADAGAAVDEGEEGSEEGEIVA